MSGGVDSSAAAAILAEAGHEVFGVSMRVHDFSDPARGKSCCGPDDLEDARSAARSLGIPFYVTNLEEHFGRTVIDRFVREYLEGCTPNPCVACNIEVKFDWLLKRARALGAKLATGHYARVGRSGARLTLRAAEDQAKDQSYFLYGLDQDALSDVLFPVGELTKQAVRGVAEKAKLQNARKPESQEICFVTRGDAGDFVALRAPEQVRAGEVVATDGARLGQHAGIHRFTVGQRRGLGVSGGPPRYVVRIDPDRAQVVVGTGEEASRDRFEVREARWVSGEPPRSGTEARVKVRHRHEGELGEVSAGASGAVAVRLRKPVRGVAPGQAAVFYQGDEVLGGGRIV